MRHSLLRLELLELLKLAIISVLEMNQSKQGSNMEGQAEGWQGREELSTMNHRNSRTGP